jgi:hypothetical protein
MKKWVLVGVAIAALGTGWYFARTYWNGGSQSWPR